MIASTRSLTRSRLQQVLKAMAGRRVAVVGDAILDEFLWGDATRISPEAPVPVVLLQRQTQTLGGAANVAANIAGLGGQPVLFSIVGDDAAGVQLCQLIQRAGIEIGAVPTVAGRPTTVKNRVLARNKHLLRFDCEDTSPIASATVRQLLTGLRAGRFDALVVSDYAKGCITPELVRAVARYCAASSIPWCVDPKLTTIRYRQATVLKPNQIELAALSGFATNTLDEVRRAAAAALRRHGCQNLLVTRGQHGMVLFGRDGSEYVLNGGGQAVSDVTGAGDTVSATLALALAAGLPLAAAAAAANFAAGYVITLPGTAIARHQDLMVWADRHLAGGKS